jgi:recombination protein RecA
MGVTFGSPDVTPGGKALKFYATVRVDMRRIAAVKDGKDDDPTGHMVRAKVIKNKVAPPFRVAEFEITYNGRGVNKEKEVLEIGAKCGILNKSGSWYSYGENRIGQGLAACGQFLQENPGLMVELTDKILDLKLPHRREQDECAEMAD